MLFLLLLPIISFANVEALAGRVMSLRGEVEESAASLEQARKRASSESDMLLQRIADLEGQLHKERLKALQLGEKQKGVLASSARSPKEEFRALEDWVKQLREFTEQSLPLQKEEKLEALRSLEKRVQEQRESAVTLATELWSFTEKNLKQSGSNEYRLTSIPIEGALQEAEVARIGNLHAVFRSSRGIYGFTKRNPKGVTWEKAAPLQQAAIDRILQQFRQKNTTGWFEIPGLQKGTL